MKNSSALFWLILGLLGSQISCGGGSGGASGSCGKVYPCGGAIAGDWKVVDSCYAANLTGGGPDFCPEATLTAQNLKVAGTVTYRADLTFTRVTQASGVFVMDLPNSCLTTLDVTCAEWDAAQKEAIANDPESPFSAVSCVSRTASCACLFTAMQGRTNTATGTYTTSGTALTETDTGEGPETSSYCVQDKTLHISELDMTMPMGTMGQFKIVSDVVLTKQ